MNKKDQKEFKIEEKFDSDSDKENNLYEEKVNLNKTKNIDLINNKKNLGKKSKDLDKDEKDNHELSDISEVFKKKKSYNNVIPNLNNMKFKPYLGYAARIVTSALLFIFSFSLSYFLVRNAFVTTETTKTTYQEVGNIDYRVNLKENDFYESKYLTKGMVYITSLISTIDIDFDYRFIIDESINGNFTNGVVAKLIISNDSGDNVYYSKDYVLSSTKTEVVSNKNIYNTRKTISIDYSYYNNVANKFKSTYGVDSSSKLIVSYKVGGNISDKGISSSNDLSVTIPLSQKAINISDSGGLNNSRTNITEAKTELKYKSFIVIAIILFITSIACLLKFLELIFAMFGKTTAYDKHLNKIFKEYDRLIVEIKTAPNFDNKNIITIDKFEELLDARDTLKQPIMYYNLSSHNKCYFYIKNEDDIYLHIVKSVDLESDKNEEKKKK